ncbi:uncharacterized protein LOC134442034 [Engraulis encrasicolus]|uniref:uncharacterized protein LOC134442034 n=1 Tax=Engraulis encrasicolus TaxID=184585 RepID=UPI002FD66C9E
MRTQFGKLLKPKASGSGQKSTTPKQMWLMKQLDFLKSHVVPRHTESTLTLGTDSDDGEEDSIVSMSNTPSPVTVTPDEETTPPTESTGQAVKRPRATKPTMKAADMEMVKLSLLQRVQNTLESPPADAEEVFGQQVASEVRSIKDRVLQLRLKRDIMNLIYDAQEAEMAFQMPNTNTSHPGSYGHPGPHPRLQYQGMQPYQPQAPSPQDPSASTQPMYRMLNN